MRQRPQKRDFSERRSLHAIGDLASSLLTLRSDLQGTKLGCPILEEHSLLSYLGLSDYD